MSSEGEGSDEYVNPLDQATKWPSLMDVQSKGKHSFASDIIHPQPSPFFSLPPELRNNIYKLVLPTGQVHTVYAKSRDLKPTMAEPAISRTCRQIRQETLALFYGLNRFKMCSEVNCVTVFASWWHTTGRKHDANVESLHAVREAMNRLYKQTAMDLWWGSVDLPEGSLAHLHFAFRSLARVICTVGPPCAYSSIYDRMGTCRAPDAKRFSRVTETPSEVHRLSPPESPWRIIEGEFYMTLNYR